MRHRGHACHACRHRYFSHSRHARNARERRIAAVLVRRSRCGGAGRGAEREMLWHRGADLRGEAARLRRPQLEMPGIARAQRVDALFIGHALQPRKGHRAVVAAVDHHVHGKAIRMPRRTGPRHHLARERSPLFVQRVLAHLAAHRLRDGHLVPELGLHAFHDAFELRAEGGVERADLACDARWIDHRRYRRYRRERAKWLGARDLLLVRCRHRWLLLLRRRDLDCRSRRTGCVSADLLYERANGRRTGIGCGRSLGHGRFQ